MPNLLIASTTPGAGKTTVACWIASRAADAGRKPRLARAFAKFGAQRGTDIAAMSKLFPGATPVQPYPARSINPTADEMAAAARGLESLQENGGLAIVEGLSGSAEANRRFADELDAQVVLVAQWGDDPVPLAKAFENRLVGVIYNVLPIYRQHALKTKWVPALEAARIPYLGAVPDDRRLLAVTVGEIASHLSGKFALWQEKSNELVDYFLIGGNVWDWGVHYFSTRENAAAVIRGDRPDIQMAALATPIKALVLTAGNPPIPIQYVEYEAGQEEVPTIVVPLDTHKTMALLETIQDRARFDHPGKLARMRELADPAIDFSRIEEALAQPVGR